MARRKMLEDSQHAMFASISRLHAERSASLVERASAHAEKRATKATDTANACRRK
jgi:hypothetical protein